MTVKEIQEAVKRLTDEIAKSMHAISVPKIFCDPTPLNTKIGGIIKYDAPPLAAILEYCDYKGKRCRVVSKNYQTGEAVLEGHDVTGPYVLTVKLADVTIENPRAGNKCTCGNDSLPESRRGKCSDFCDKFYKGY